MLDPELILEGTQYILSKADSETFWQKTWSEHLTEVKTKNDFEDHFNRILTSHNN